MPFPLADHPPEDDEPPDDEGLEYHDYFDLRPAQVRLREALDALTDMRAQMFRNGTARD